MGGLGIKSWYNSELSLHKLPTLDKTLEDFGIFPKEENPQEIVGAVVSSGPAKADDDTIALKRRCTSTTTPSGSGRPAVFSAAINASYLLMTNPGITVSVVHVVLWHYKSVRAAFNIDWRALAKPNCAAIRTRLYPQTWLRMESFASNVPIDNDLHYFKMLAYAKALASWHLGIIVVSTLVALGCTYCPLDAALALSLASNLKLQQYSKLSPRCTSSMTLAGTLLGAVINYALMNAITTSQPDIILGIQGTNIWSGQVIHSFNLHAIAFGALSQFLFSVGRTYGWILLALPLGFVLPIPFCLLLRRFPRAGFNTVFTPVISWYLG
ncbi:hypothetical protein SEUCBS139899_008477 [Sporothrix eucalyptigena]|uniref:Uncharacterized protein n=1 Tax=Sporothrix eucalyptigena TaxID=1812306 RepID=A0ABP0C9J3_9PEZI